MSIGNKIRKLRKERGLTQEKLGELIGVKKSAVAKYENNRVENLKRATIQKLAEVLEVSPSYFFEDDITNISNYNNSSYTTFDELLYFEVKKILSEYSFNQLLQMNEKEIKKIEEYIDFLYTKNRK